MYTCIPICVYIYLFIYRERERAIHTYRVVSLVPRCCEDLTNVYENKDVNNDINDSGDSTNSDNSNDSIDSMTT